MEEGRSSCVHATCAHHHEETHSQTTQYHKWAGERSEELVFAISYMTGMSLWQLPMEYIDGNPVPTVIFHGKPTTFHAFVLGLVVSLSAAVCAIQLRERNSKAARCYRLFAVGAMVVTVAILMWAAVPAGFLWVASFVQQRNGIDVIGATATCC